MTNRKVDQIANSEDHDVWTKLAHYAHYAHLTAEAIEAGAHLGHFEGRVIAAQKLLKTHGQMAFDLARMYRGIWKLKNVAKDGGRRERLRDGG